MFASIAIAALLAASSQAAPDAASPSANPPPAEAKADAKAKPKMRRVCYSSVTSGSRLERKTCVMERVDEEDAASKAPKPDA